MDYCIQIVKIPKYVQCDFLIQGNNMMFFSKPYTNYWLCFCEVFNFLDDYAEREFATHKLAYRDANAHDLWVHPKFIDGPIIINKNYRALYRLPSDKMNEMAGYIKDLEDLYFKAMIADHKKSEKRPRYFPYLFDGTDIDSIIIHTSTTKGIRNYRDDAIVPIDRMSSFTERDVQWLILDVNNAGFDCMINAHSPSLGELFADDFQGSYAVDFGIRASDLCKRYECDSVQLKSPVGKRCRFTTTRTDHEGRKVVSKQRELGVMVLVGDAEISYRDSSNNDREDLHRIDLGIVKTGVLYRKFD